MRLRSYEGLQEPRGTDEGLLKGVLHGLSYRRYEGCGEAVPEAFGLRDRKLSFRHSKQRRWLNENNRSYH